MKNKTIAVFGEVFSSNLGDYAIYDSLSSILHKFGVTVIPMDLSLRKNLPKDRFNNHFEDKDRSLKANITQSLTNKLSKNSIRYISLINWQLIKKQQVKNYWYDILKDTDGIIIGGGQLLTESQSNFLPKIYQIARIASSLDIPVSIVGCGAGANMSLKNLNLCKKIFSNCKYISFRDYNSLNLLSSQIDKSAIVKVHPDLAFALAPPPLLDNFKRSKLRCGLNIIPLSFFREYSSDLKSLNSSSYLLFWKKIAEGVQKLGMEVVIMTNGSLEDFRQARKIHESLSNLGINTELLERPSNPDSLYSSILDIDYLISTRMHAGIVAYTFGKKVATITWDEKIPSVWGAFGNSHVVLDANILLQDDPWITVEQAFQSNLYNEKHTKEIKDIITHELYTCLSVMF